MSSTLFVGGVLVVTPKATPLLLLDVLGLGPIVPLDEGLDLVQQPVYVLVIVLEAEVEDYSQLCELGSVDAVGGGVVLLLLR
eukprot:8357986-Pyramimonas_sp.AAC.1